MSAVLERTSAVSIYLADLAETLEAKPGPLATFAWGQLSVELFGSHDSLWTVIRRAGTGGLAVRSAFVPGGYDVRVLRQGNAVPAVRLTSR